MHDSCDNIVSRGAVLFQKFFVGDLLSCCRARCCARNCARLKPGVSNSSQDGAESAVFIGQSWTRSRTDLLELSVRRAVGRMRPFARPRVREWDLGTAWGILLLRRARFTSNGRLNRPAYGLAKGRRLFKDQTKDPTVVDKAKCTIRLLSNPNINPLLSSFPRRRSASTAESTYTFREVWEFSNHQTAPTCAIFMPALHDD